MIKLVSDWGMSGRGGMGMVYNIVASLSFHSGYVAHYETCTVYTSFDSVLSSLPSSEEGGQSMCPVPLRPISSCTPAPQATVVVAMTPALATGPVSTRIHTLTLTTSVPVADEVREGGSGEFLINCRNNGLVRDAIKKQEDRKA